MLVKGADQKELSPDLEMEIIRQEKNRRAIKLCVSTRWVKVKMMKLVKDHYFFDSTWRIHQAQGFLASCHWMLALMHHNNFGLKRRSKKEYKYLEDVLLRCRMFHNGLCR